MQAVINLTKQCLANDEDDGLGSGEAAQASHALANTALQFDIRFWSIGRQCFAHVRISCRLRYTRLNYTSGHCADPILMSVYT